ncbi:hypothetical protein PIB30_086153 [Stylosanthes scabra]|uniref:Uncharacterized protein n=1 Tax=Stylosanthes scabra TaxID=79078 RepID=A0ABU6WRD9_9FABA|nr:hypothetical protein [Stylosanthes scabra]
MGDIASVLKDIREGQQNLLNVQCQQTSQVEPPKGFVLEDHTIVATHNFYDQPSSNTSNQGWRNNQAPRWNQPNNPNQSSQNYHQHSSQPHQSSHIYQNQSSYNHNQSQHYQNQSHQQRYQPPPQRQQPSQPQQLPMDDFRLFLQEQRVYQKQQATQMANLTEILTGLGECIKFLAPLSGIEPGSPA